MLMDVSTLRLVAVPGGVRFGVHVKPHASKSSIAGVREGALDVRVAAPPVDGAANEELVRALARALGVARSEVAIVRGQSSRDKLVEVLGLSTHEAWARLRAARGVL
jgi:uncharacterized protein (TIGR00251 family)